MVKSVLRERYLAQRLALENTECDRRSESICEKLAHFFKTQGSFSQVCLYFSMRNEPAVERLADKLRDLYDFALPVVQKSREMKFFKWDSNTVLKKSRFQIWEPEESTSSQVVVDTKTVLLVPALAVDEEGYRLGFGGGFYDKFLETHSGFLKIAVVYSEFFVKSLPREAWDERVDWICTENGVFPARPTEP